MSFEDIESGRSSYGGGQSNNPFSIPNQGGNQNFQYGAGAGGGYNQDSKWDRLHETVYNGVNDMAKHVPATQRMIGKIGTSDDSPQLREQIRARMEGMRKSVKTTADGVKMMKRMEMECDDASVRNTRRKVSSKLEKDFLQWINQFKELSKLWASKGRQAVPASTIPAANGAAYQGQPGVKAGTPGGWGGLGQEYYSQYDQQDDESSSLVATHNRQVLQQIDNEAEFNDMLIREREQGIKEIETTVLEVNEMFRDLGTIVTEQGVMIDSIENHIETAAIETDHGVEELVKAQGHQKSANRKMCLIFIICVVVLAVIVVCAALGVGFYFG